MDFDHQSIGDRNFSIVNLATIENFQLPKDWQLKKKNHHLFGVSLWL
jgi:hypothetical protein